jgi:hypothetical protein
MLNCALAARHTCVFKNTLIYNNKKHFCISKSEHVWCVCALDNQNRITHATRCESVYWKLKVS